VHELSLCQNLIDQLTSLARQHGAMAVSRVEVHAGPLSGVEPQLLETAFLMAREGTVADTAELVIESPSPRVVCADCAVESGVLPNDLTCPHCGSTDTTLVGGHELILARVELIGDESLTPS
jgi:hydrogenase nickel incorporation protein HypA/HybF